MKFIQRLVLATLVSSSLTYAAEHQQDEVFDEHYYQTHQIKSSITDMDDGYTFLVVGDWGRNGHFAQRSVAKWMDVASYQFDADMIISTGDNFYENGVASVNDPYWQSSYEAIYDGPSLFVDWYVVLGNHDYRGNWQAQIDYSDISRRWNMPAQYFEKMIKLEEGGTVHLVFLDTNPLNPDYQHEPKYQETQRQDGKAQLAWFEQTLKDNENADWTIVIGHHPLYSSGKRYGETGAVRGVIEPLLEKYEVDAYIAGHEHDLQHNKPAGSSVEHFVSGGGSEIRPVAQREFTAFAKSSAGFAVVKVNHHTFTLEFIDDKGKALYHYDLDKSKK
ncbi:acid phosphatase [Salinimonas sp. HHU 13199]|uniref:acid phosphatase n=1 Tax=Salinimonas profundi TaxID=2729140 RepID=A0ABR8LJ52_9ALTE|nr:tartrate-resistant acid phosphatase type 5 family protein [Salinimonas profundi]MBD3585608.1 acid phosphatase [Salinimonas profundi]